MINLKKMAEDLENREKNLKWQASQGEPGVIDTSLVDFGRQVAAEVLSEARARCHDLISKGEADPGNIIRVFKNLKRELCGNEEDKE